MMHNKNSQSSFKSKEPAQRSDVESKYDFIYEALALVSRAVMAEPALDPLETYRKLRDILSGTWATIGRLSEESRKQGSGAIEYSVLLSACAEYNGTMCSWTERGRHKNTTRREFDQAHSKSVTEILLYYIPEDCDLILDLGCGWGHRMFDLWLGRGPSGARYMGGDRSRHSEALVRKVATLFPEMPVDWFPFDFLRPDFASLNRVPRNIAVFTVHAIEQVKQIGPQLFDQLVAQFPHAKITGIHIEPIGFQFEEDIHRHLNSVAIDRSYAEKRQYNLDLVHQVRVHNKLSVTATEVGVLDMGGGNSTSVLVWASR
jgi:hypothetical protein